MRRRSSCTRSPTASVMASTFSMRPGSRAAPSTRFCAALSARLSCRHIGRRPRSRTTNSDRHGATTSSQQLERRFSQIWAIDPRQSIFRAATLDDWVSQSLLGRRFNLFLIGGFAVATLLLAMAGVYGVMSFTTSQRTRAFGVRMALGPVRRDILWLVLGDWLRLAGCGVIIGVAVALALTRLMRALLFGVSATDPVTFLSVSIVLLLVATAACYLPASGALNVDPVEAMRIE